MKQRWDLIKDVRGKLGIGLREAADFYEQNPSTCEVRLEAAVAKFKTSGVFYEAPIDKIRAAIKKYYADLDQRQNGFVAADEAFRKIQEILGMSWSGSEAPPVAAERDVAQTPQAPDKQAVRDANIKMLRSKGYAQGAIASQLGIHQSVVSKVLRTDSELASQTVKIRLLRSKGHTQKEIVEILGISRVEVSRALRVPRGTNTKTNLFDKSRTQS